METLKINYFGVTRELPKVTLPSGDKIAFFDSVGDIELINTACRELARFVQDYCVIDRRPTYIVTTELKGIPIAQAVATYFNIPYVVLRKSKKPYMTNPREFWGNSVTSGKQSYWIDDATADKLRGAVVWFIDDVFSTGGTLTLVKDICNYFGASLTFGGFIMQEAQTTSTTTPLETTSTTTPLETTSTTTPLETTSTTTPLETTSTPTSDFSDEEINIPYFEFDGITCFATAILHMECAEVKDGGEVSSSK